MIELKVGYEYVISRKKNFEYKGQGCNFDKTHIEAIQGDAVCASGYGWIRTDCFDWEEIGIYVEPETHWYGDDSFIWIMLLLTFVFGLIVGAIIIRAWIG